MLLIDGVRYEEWTPPSEEEFERVVKEHAQEIFGEKSIYLDLKRKLKSKAGIGSIPDGFVIIFGTSPHWHIIEIELSTHPLYEHIVSQVGRFIRGINNPNIQREIVNAFDEEIAKDEFLKLRLRKAIDPTEIHRFLSDRVEQNPILTIIIEKKKTDELTEALNTLNYSQIKVVEFRTFVREGADLAVHAHLFEPLYAPEKRRPEGGHIPPISTPSPPPEKSAKSKGRKVLFEELIEAGLIEDGQTLYFYNTRPFSEERAQVVVSSNKLKYEADGKIYSKSELAKILLVKHGFKHDELGVAGPKYWKTEDGKLLVDLEEQVRKQRGDRI